MLLSRCHIIAAFVAVFDASIVLASVVCHEAATPVVFGAVAQEQSGLKFLLYLHAATLAVYLLARTHFSTVKLSAREYAQTG